MQLTFFQQTVSLDLTIRNILKPDRTPQFLEARAKQRAAAVASRGIPECDFCLFVCFRFVSFVGLVWFWIWCLASFGLF